MLGRAATFDDVGNVAAAPPSRHPPPPHGLPRDGFTQQPPRKATLN